MTWGSARAERAPPQANGPGRVALSTATNGEGSTAGAVQKTTTTETDDVMPASPPLPPAYLATIRPLPLHHPSLRRVRLSARQVDALTGRTVPMAIDGTSPVTPCAQAELAIQDDTRDVLGDRETCAVLHRWSYGGELWVMCDGSFVQVANIELTPAPTEMAA